MSIFRSPENLLQRQGESVGGNSCSQHHARAADRKNFHDELTAFARCDSEALRLETGRILMVGLNGSGKTTSSAKLARFLQKQDYSPVLVPCDLQRPAAVEQLVALGNQVGFAGVRS